MNDVKHKIQYLKCVRHLRNPAANYEECAMPLRPVEIIDTSKECEFCINPKDDGSTYIRKQSLYKPEEVLRSPGG